MSSVPRASARKRKISPLCRQDILTQRLLLTLEPETSGQDAARKQPSPYAVPSSAGLTVSPARSGSKSLSPIDAYDTWKEISSVFPLLSYGEESNELFLALMGILPTNAAEADDAELLRGLDFVLSDMLRVSRNSLRDDSLAIAVEAEQNAAKKQKISSYQSFVTTSNQANVKESNEVLPWNVLLRAVVRFTTFVTKRIQSKCPKEMNAMLKDPVPTFASATTTLKSSWKSTSEESLPKQKLVVQAAVSTTVNKSIESFKVAAVASMNINDIRRELKKRGLDSKGKKAELIMRFQRCSADDNTTTSNTVEINAASTVNACNESPEITPVASMALNDIRSELTKRGLDSTGKKLELIERSEESIPKQKLVAQSAVDTTVDTSDESFEVADVASMDTNDIRRELKKRGLDSKGKKAELIKQFTNTSDELPEVTSVARMSFHDIRSELAERGLDSTGNKIQLIARLQRHLKEEMSQEKPVKREACLKLRQQVQALGEVDNDDGLRKEMEKEESCDDGGGKAKIKADKADIKADAAECKMSTPTKAILSNQSPNLTPKSSNVSVSKSTLSLQTTPKSNDGTDTKGNSESSVKRIHPVIQALDIVLSELTIILRREQRRRLKKEQKCGTSLVAEVKHKESIRIQKGVGNKGLLENDNLQPSLTQQQPSKTVMSLVKEDRMIHDWINKSRCGPSRYAFMKDVDFVTHNLNLALLKITQEEWQEKIDTIVGYMDEYVGFDGNNAVSTVVGDGVLGRSSFGTFPLSSPLRKPPLSSPFSRSPLSSPYRCSIAAGLSLADITRVHVKRAIDMNRETERDASRKSNTSHLPSKKPDLCRSLNVKTLDPISEVEMEDDIDQSEDAYRMALAFSSSDESRNDEGCDTVQRRLELLVKLLHDRKEKKQKSPCSQSSRSSMTCGADSYLRLLLRELLQPSDPAVWARLMEESDGKDTPMQLRRGRSSLVSFLVEIHAPGWEDICSSLNPSPLADYLGFLSDRNDSASNQKTQNLMFLRSSFLLPVVDDNATSMPPPPVVTEIGLSACVSNFLQKERGTNSSGISYVFNRRAGPDSLGKPDPMLESIAVTLPDVGELTRDMFDLTLRLAADDDSEHKSKPFPLRLATPSASESLRIVLDVVSDHAEWLEPRSVFKRYQSVMEMFMLSFGSFGGDKNISEAWESRLSHLIRMAKTVQNRARVAIYATHFMIMLCSKKPSSEHNCLNGQSKFYHRLHLQQFSQFWNDIEETSNGYSTNVMAQVFDENFCTRRLLPLTHHCSALLARSLLPSLRAECPTCSSEESESVLSLITILCSVFGLLSEDNLLTDCIHVGWSVEVISLSIKFFIQCENVVSMNCVPARNPLWHRVLDNLTKLYNDVWENCRPDLDVGKCQSSVSPETSSFVCVERVNGNVRTWRLMPSFDVLVASLVEFASDANLGENGEFWCKFVSAFLLDRYARVIPMNAVALSWIRSLASTLQCKVLRQKVLELKDDVSIDRAVDRLMSPLLKSIHYTIMTQHALRASSRSKPFTADRDMIATAFADLFKQESAKILTKPSSLKTRKWHIYRACIDSLFTSTPPGTMFTCLGCSGLTESSADALRDVWEHFGQSHSTTIMVAAGLHVDASVTRLQSTSIDSASKKLKKLCDAFTLQAKKCISNTITCFASKDSKSHSDASTIGFHEFVHDVGRDLTSHYAEAGLIWWNDLTSELSSLLADTNKPKCDSQSTIKDKSVSRKRRNITHVFSSLEENLSTISHLM